MTDDPKTTESKAEGASAELPIPKLESPSTGSSTSGVDMDALAEKVANKLRPDFEKVAQSTKDKRIAALEKRVGLSDLAELEEMGVTIPESAKTEYRLRQLEGTRQQAPASSQLPSSPGNGEALTAQDVQTVVKNLSLDANDAEVLEKLRGIYRNKDHFTAEMTTLALSRVTRQPPSPTSATALTAEKAAPPVDVQTKIAKLSEMQKQPTKYKAEIAKLTAELDAVNWGG